MGNEEKLIAQSQIMDDLDLIYKCAGKLRLNQAYFEKNKSELMAKIYDVRQKLLKVIDND